MLETTGHWIGAAWAFHPVAGIAVIALLVWFAAVVINAVRLFFEELGKVASEVGEDLSDRLSEFLISAVLLPFHLIGWIGTGINKTAVWIWESAGSFIIAVLDILIERAEGKKQERLSSDQEAREEKNYRQEQANDPPPRDRGRMPYEDAVAVLGLSREGGFTQKDVTAKYRSLIGKIHPDRGGTNYLAQQLNEAVEIIKARHGWR